MPLYEWWFDRSGLERARVRKLAVLASVFWITLAFLLLTVATAQAEGPTYVSGVIDTDTTWTLADSPYIVTGNVLVSSGVTLTIEAGVEVQFDGNYYLQVDGTLISRGTATQTIRFTSDGYWGGIRFTGTSTPASYDVDGEYVGGCIIEYSEMERGGINMTDASPFVSHNTIRQISVPGVKTTTVIRSSGGAPIIEYNVITGNHVQVCAAVCMSGGGILRDNYIVDNSAVDNAGGIMVSGSVVVTNNVIMGNRNGNDAMFPAYVGAGGIRASGPSVVIDRNLIVNNWGAPAGGVVLKDGADLTNNTVVNNEWAYGGSANKAGGIGIVGSGSNLEGNNIFGNLLYDVYNATASDVSAAQNWWGTTDTTLIDEHIHDYYDDFNLGVVNYQPISTAPFENTPPIPPGTPTDSDTTAYSGYDDDPSLDFTWTASWDDVGLDHYNVYTSTDGGAYGSPITTTTNSYSVTGADGHTYKIRVEAVDTSAKVSWPSESDEVFVDLVDPSSSVSPLSPSQASTSFTVAWSGSDNVGGSGLKWYDVQYKDGASGTWTDWKTHTTDSYATFTGQDGHTYYFQSRAQDNAGNWEAYPGGDGDTHTTIQDTHSPTGNVVINGGAEYTNQVTVTLTLNATDNMTVTEMIISNDSSFTGASWEPYTTSKQWTLPSGDGEKTVYVKYRDAALNESEVYSDSIILETDLPTGSIIINGGAIDTTSRNVMLGLSANDNPSPVTSMRLSNDGTNYTSWWPFVSSSTWTLGSGDGLKTAYVQYKDNAGNISLTYTDTITLNTTVGTLYGATINGGALWTNSTWVTMTLSCQVGTADMMVSNDGSFPDAAWEPFRVTKPWMITAYGSQIIPRTVYVRFRDTVGVPSATYQDDIILDTNAPNSQVTGARVTEGSEHLLESSLVPVKVTWTGEDDNSGVRWYDIQYRVDRSGTWTTWLRRTRQTSAIFDATPGHTYYFRSRARDRAGNWEDYPGGDGDVSIRIGAATNALSNGSFEKDGRIPAPWRGNRRLTLKDRRVCTTAHHGSCSFKMVGTSAKKSLRQVLDISGSAGDSLTLSGWSRARDPSSTGGAYCLQARVFHTDGTKKAYRKCFAKRTHGWQYRERSFTVDKDYNKIVVFLLYARQSGKAWFDHVKLLVPR